MFQRVLLVFENERVCRQALNYARELALRMDSEVSFLMLVEMAFPDRSFLGQKRNAISRLEERMAQTLGGFSTEFLQGGVSVSSALRIGDPPQELLKFLAERPPFHAIIWGSGEGLQEGDRQLPREHWMKKVSALLECPLLTVSQRSGRGRGSLPEGQAGNNESVERREC